MKLSLIIPTYNEKGNIESLLSNIQKEFKLQAIEGEIIVVDDNSPDGTGDLLDTLKSTYPNLVVVHRTGKLGLSSAVTDGFAIASGDIWGVMDADLSHPVDAIHTLYQAVADGASLAIGSRYVEGGSIENWSMYRKVLSWGATLLARCFTSVSDPMSGFFFINKKHFDGADINQKGFKILLELLIKNRFSTIVEVPITFIDRVKGKSKAGVKEILYYLKSLSQYVPYKVKIFLKSQTASQKACLIFLGLALIIRVLFASYLATRGWDESVYLNLGHDLSMHPLHYSLAGSGWSDFIPSTEALYQWPNIGFRAPLLSYMFALLYGVHLSFLVPMLVPLVGLLSIFVLYKIGEKLFDKQTALYGALFLALLPLHVLLSAKSMTDVPVTFLLLCSVYSFWQGYEKGQVRHKVLFGVWMALALLCRYTTLWMIPVFFLYLLIRDRSFVFLRDRYFWYMTGVFLLVLSPWLLYSFFSYGTPFGSIIYGFKAAAYWGSVQSWAFYLVHSWYMLSIIALAFIFSVYFIIRRRLFHNRGVYLLLLWIVIFAGMSMFMPHKEARFILPVAPALCLLCGVWVSNLKKYRIGILIACGSILIMSLGFVFVLEYKTEHTASIACFTQATQFIANESALDAVVFTDQSPLVYLHLHKETHAYPNPWSIEALKSIVVRYYPTRHVYLLIDHDDELLGGQVKDDLASNFQNVFECRHGGAQSTVYTL